MTFATRLAATGKAPIYILEQEGDSVLPSDFADVTNWTAEDAAGTLADDTTDAIEGASSIGWDKTGGGSVNAGVSLTPSASVDITDGSWDSIYLKAPTALTDVDSCLVRIGSNSLNYYEWTIPDSWFTAAKWHFVRLSELTQETGWSFSTTGSPDLSVD